MPSTADMIRFNTYLTRLTKEERQRFVDDSIKWIVSVEEPKTPDTVLPKLEGLKADLQQIRTADTVAHMWLHSLFFKNGSASYFANYVRWATKTI
jgi:hypothetical protein